MGVSKGKNTRFPNGEFSINCHSEEPVLDNAWELIENSKHGNLHFRTRWESKTQVWKLSAGSLTEKRKLIQYWDTPQKYQCKIPALGTKVRWPTSATAKQKVTAKQISTRGTTK